MRSKKRFIKYALILSLLSLPVLNSNTTALAKSQSDANMITTYLTDEWKPSTSNQLDMVWEYLEDKRNVLGINGDLEDQFKIAKVTKDPKTNYVHYRLQQYYGGLPIYGSEQTIHIHPKNKRASFLGRVLMKNQQSIKLKKSEKAISESKVYSTVVKDLEHTLNFNIKMGDIRKTSELYLYPLENKNFVKAYLVSIAGTKPSLFDWSYVVDANTGKIINKLNHLVEFEANGLGVLGDEKTFEVSSKGNQKTPIYLVDTKRGNVNKGGGIFTYNFYEDLPVSDADGYFDEDGAAVDAHTYAEKTYDFYNYYFNRKSFDGNDTAITSVVHVPDSDGGPMNNAYWSSTYNAMFYGDGDGSTMRPFSAAPDVVAHEITHGVIQHTAGLEYSFQSGALNESIADIFASVIAPDDEYLLGENLHLDRQSGDRSLKDPTLFDQPDHLSKYVNLPISQDNGGVHINSGINNKAAYLIAEGGKHYGVNVKGIGRIDMAYVYYGALSYHLTKFSNFQDMRLAAIESAIQTFGETSSEVKSVKQAYDAVGIKGENSSEDPYEGEQGNDSLYDATTLHWEDNMLTNATISNAEDMDYYVIQVPEYYLSKSVKYNVQFKSPAGKKFKTEIIDESEQIIANSEDSGDNYQVSLIPGEIYYVVVSSEDGNYSQSPYQLGFSASMDLYETHYNISNQLILTNNTLSNATPLRIDTEITEISASLDDKKDTDFFQIKNDKPNSKYTFTLTNIPAGRDYDLYLLDSKGKNLSSSKNKGPEKIFKLMAKGTYYIKIAFSPKNKMGGTNENYLLTIKK